MQAHAKQVNAQPSVCTLICLRKSMQLHSHTCCNATCVAVHTAHLPSAAASAQRPCTLDISDGSCDQSKLTQRREDSRISTAFVTSLNTFLLKHGLDVSSRSPEIQRALHPFVLHCWKTSRDAKLKDALVVCLSVQVKLQGLQVRHRPCCCYLSLCLLHCLSNVGAAAVVVFMATIAHACIGSRAVCVKMSKIRLLTQACLCTRVWRVLWWTYKSF